MKSKLHFTFIFMFSAAVWLSAVFSANGQGIGDRNRPSSGGQYEIIGRVFLPNGKAAEGIRMTLSGADFTNSSTTTDADGAFAFGSVPAGNYTLSARAEGFENERESLTIERSASAGHAFKLAIHLRLPGQPKVQLRQRNPLLADVPDDALAKYQKGIEKLAKNDAKGAISDFDAAISQYPNFAAAWYEKGIAYLKANDLDKALEAFVKAISVKPDYLEAKYSVGYTQLLKKNYEVAAAVFDDVLKQKNDFALAQMYLGVSLYYLKNVDAAEASLKRAIAMKDDVQVALAHRYLGGIYAQKNRNAEAAAELQKYLDMVPTAPDADRLKNTIAELKKKS